MPHKLVKYYLSVCSLIFAGLVLTGIFFNYSPVPFWDMWGPYVEFYSTLEKWNLSGWFAQHNEHRIFLSRILYFIDMHWFKGSIYFLLAMNFILLSCIALVFHQYIRYLFPSDDDQETRLILTPAVIVLGFSWLQNNNITWGFQSQFLLAYLLPLLAFWSLGLAILKNSKAWFVLSLGIGAFSAVTMANGVLTLPLMCAMILISRKGAARFFFGLAITFAVLFLYFRNYAPVEGHGSMSETIRNHTLDFILYIFTYLGSPFHFIQPLDSLRIPQFAGITLMLASLWSAGDLIIKKDHHPMVSGLVFFLAYIGGTAFATAGGRAVFGLKQATDSRYLTPALMGWIALLLVYAYKYRRHIPASRLFLSIVVLLPVIFLPSQLNALKNNTHTLSQRMIGVLAVELDIRDETYTKTIFPFSDWLFRIAVIPREKNLTIFGHPLIRDIGSRIGRKVSANPALALEGNIDEQFPIDETTTRIRGWVFDGTSGKIPESLLVADSDFRMVGYVLSGLDRPDVSQVIDSRARFSGFEGYMMRPVKAGEPLYLIHEKTGRTMIRPMPVLGR